MTEIRSCDTASTYVSRTCPACGSAEVASTGTIASSPRAEDIPPQELARAWAGFFAEKPFFTYRRCRQCALLYCPTYIASDALHTLYGHMADNTAGLPVSALRRTQEGYLAALGTGAVLAGGYLELGPDIGLLTQAVLRRGSFDRIWLFEPNREVWPELRACVPPGAHLAADVDNFTQVPEHSVNLAAMVHVLDHLVDPLETLRRLRTRLVPGGRVLIVTHDERSLLARLVGRRWPPYCPQHPQLFNRSTVSAMLARAGFRTLSVTGSTNHFPALYLLRHALFAARLRVPVDRYGGGPTLPARLGNMVTVATPDLTAGVPRT